MSTNNNDIYIAGMRTTGYDGVLWRYVKDVGSLVGAVFTQEFDNILTAVFVNGNDIYVVGNNEYGVGAVI